MSELKNVVLKVFMCLWCALPSTNNMGAAQRKELRQKHESLVHECDTLKRNLKEARAAKDALEAKVRDAQKEQDAVHAAQWGYLSEEIEKVGKRFATCIERVVYHDLTETDLSISIAAMLRDCKATEILVHMMTELMQAKFDSSVWTTSICFFCWRVLQTYQLCRKLLGEHANGDAYFTSTLKLLDDYIARIKDDMSTDQWVRNIFKKQLDIFSDDVEHHVKNLNDADESIEFECRSMQRLDFSRLEELKSFVRTVLKVYGRLSEDTAVAVVNKGSEKIVVTITKLRKTGQYQKRASKSRDAHDAPPAGPSSSSSLPGGSNQQLQKPGKKKKKGTLDAIPEADDENTGSCLRAAHMPWRVHAAAERQPCERINLCNSSCAYAVACSRCGRKGY